MLWRFRMSSCEGLQMLPERILREHTGDARLLQLEQICESVGSGSSRVTCV